jgi:hypothetical protein
MVCDFTASDELCSAPLPFRFMTGLWLVAPCSLSSTLPSSLCAPVLAHGIVACSRNCDLCLSLAAPEQVCKESLARSPNCDLCVSLCARTVCKESLAHVIASFVLSRVVSNRVGSSSPQSLYVSFFSLATKYV